MTAQKISVPVMIHPSFLSGIDPVFLILEIVSFDNDFPFALYILVIFSGIAIEKRDFAIPKPHLNYAHNVWFDLRRAYARHRWPRRGLRRSKALRCNGSFIF